MSSSSSLSLFKQMMREAAKFQDFNFRSYALRRVRDGFKEGKQANPEQAKEQMEVARKNFEMLKRQTTIGNLFNPGQKLSIEINAKK